MTAPFRLPSTRREEIPWDDALAAVLGYACGTRTLTVTERGPLPGQSVDVPASAYRAYDCVPASPGDGFSWLDVLVVDALNGGMDHKAITALKHAGDRAWPHVAEAAARAAGTPFWALPASDVQRLPDSSSAGGALWHAWAECIRTSGVGVALTHKLLHHKRPALFPLIDRQTAPRLEEHVQGKDDGLWGVIHRELAANSDQFSALEAAFGWLLDGAGDVPLQRLRLHDVLLWLVATGNWDGTVAQGRRTTEWRRWQERTTGTEPSAD